MKPGKSTILYFIIAPILVIVFLFFLAFFNIDKIISLSVNRFTDCRLAYEKWGSGLFDKREIYGLDFKLDDGSFALHADKAFLDPEFYQLVKHGRIVLNCSMEGVLLEAKAMEGSSVSDVFAVPFSPEQKYGQMKFAVIAGRDIFKISDFSASSKDVKMRGDGTLLKKKNDISVYFKISFSPEISASFPEDVRKNALSLDDDGWYSTVISYKGNALLFKAIYSLMMPT